ncbi:hypothetical protein BH10BAC3_BH10BAC3_32610 [soil metagenome]
MKQVTLNIPDKKYPFFMELVKSLDFVEKIDDSEERKDRVLSSIRQAVKEINSVKKGKLKARDARELINEI